MVELNKENETEAQSVLPKPSIASLSSTNINFEDALRLYYKRVFPYESFIKWLCGGSNISNNTLNQSSKDLLCRREFCFTLKDDIFLRYLTFSSVSELKAEMVKRLPYKIDIGAIYNARACDRAKVRSFQPLEKEIVVDIDMTDYDDVRTCCQGASICHLCWSFMAVAIQILDVALKEDFGFKHLLWVYSGRRGVHCWISDPSARKLGTAARTAVAEYLQVVTGGESKSKKVYLNKGVMKDGTSVHSGGKVHPSLDRALKIVSQHFVKICIHEQKLLDDEKRRQKILAMISSPTQREEITKAFNKITHQAKADSETYWNVLIEISKSISWKRAVDEIMLQCLYPRLDINVTKTLNHLLKAPFCIHPKTGRVCVPIDVKTCTSFDPVRSVPTVYQLTSQIDAFDFEDKKIDVHSDKSKSTTSGISKEYKKTALRESMFVFEEFLAKLSSSNRLALMEQRDANLDF